MEESRKGYRARGVMAHPEASNEPVHSASVQRIVQEKSEARSPDDARFNSVRTFRLVNNVENFNEFDGLSVAEKALCKKALQQLEAQWQVAVKDTKMSMSDFDELSEGAP